MIPVILESPFGGPNVLLNTRYGRACMKDCLLNHGESPFASHLLYTQVGVLDDSIYEERLLGMTAGFVWRHLAERTVVYTDLGISPGMEKGIYNANLIGHKVIYRKLPNWEG